MGNRKLYDLPPGNISSSAVSRITGVGLACLLKWVRTGLIRPRCYSGHVGDRSAAYAWGVPEILAVRAIRQLRAQGLPLQRVRKIDAAIRAAGEDLSSVVLWSDGASAFRVVAGSQLIDLVQRPGQHMVFPLSDWVAEVEQQHAAEVERIAGVKAG